MRYIAFDLEWNSTPPNYITRGINMHKLVKERMNSLGLNNSIPQPFFPLDNEIIEIGAVKLDDEFKTVDRFQARVCPVRLPILNPYVAKAIDITQDEMDNGASFPQVINEFYAWCREASSIADNRIHNDDDILLLAWSNSDSKAMKKNLRYYGLEEAIPFRTINVQKLFADYMGISELLSLKKACIYLDINETRKYHHAEDDAYYTAKIFQYLLAPLIDTVQKEKGSGIYFDNRKVSLLGKKSLHDFLREHKDFSYPKEKLQIHKFSSSSHQDKLNSHISVDKGTDSLLNFASIANSTMELNKSTVLETEIDHSKNSLVQNIDDFTNNKVTREYNSDIKVEVLEVNNNLFINEFSAKPRVKRNSVTGNDSNIASKRDSDKCSENKKDFSSETETSVFKSKFLSFLKKISYKVGNKNQVGTNTDEVIADRASKNIDKRFLSESASNSDFSLAADATSLSMSSYAGESVSSFISLSRSSSLPTSDSQLPKSGHKDFHNLTESQLETALSKASSNSTTIDTNTNKREHQLSHIRQREISQSKNKTNTLSKFDEPKFTNFKIGETITSATTNKTTTSKDVYDDLVIKRPDLKLENINLENKIEKQLLSKVRKIRKSEMLSDNDLRNILYYISQDSNLRRKSKFYFSKNLSNYNAFCLAKNMTFTCPSCNEKLFSITPMQLISFGHLHGYISCPNHGKFHLSLTINSYLIKKDKQKRKLSKKQQLFDLSTIALQRNKLVSTKAVIVDENKINKECQNLLVNQLSLSNQSPIRNFSKFKDLSNLQLQELDKPNRKKRFIVCRDSEDFSYKKKQNISYMTKEDMKKGKAELAFSGTFTLNKEDE